MERRGAETVLMNLYRYIDRNRFDFDFLYYTEDKTAYDDEIEALGARILRIAPPGQNGFVRRVKKVLNKYGPYDVVHSHTLFNSGLILWAAKRAGIGKRIAHSHSAGDEDGPGRNFYRAAMRASIAKNATEYLACSRAAGAYLFGEKRFEKKGFILKNALDFSSFLPQNGDAETKARFMKNIGFDSAFTTVVTHIGRYYGVKNHRFTLHLAKEMCRNNDRLLFLLAGDGPLFEKIQAEITENGLKGRVLQLGVIQDICSLIKSSDCVILPSLYEGLGLAAVEAQACGVPCVASDALPKEADLKLGLLKKLPLSDEKAWPDEIYKSAVLRSPPPEEIAAHIQTAGYDIRETAEYLSRLYEKE